MYYDEHNPPHIHALYGGYKASYDIKGVKRLSGNMSKTAERLIKKWIILRQNELLNVWQLARNKVSPLPNVEPLE